VGVVLETWVDQSIKFIEYILFVFIMFISSIIVFYRKFIFER